MKKIADMLTERSVSILTIKDDGTRHRCAYENSASGREYLIANEPTDIVAEVFTVWGNTPTVEEPVYEEIETYEKFSGGNSDTVWEEMAKAIRQGVNGV